MTILLPTSTVPSSLKTNLRLGVASLVLLALVLIVAEAMHSWRKEQLSQELTCPISQVPAVHTQEKSQEAASP